MNTTTANKEAAFRLYSQGQHLQALAAYDFLIKNGGADADVWSMHGMISALCGHLETAIASLQHSILIAPNNPAAHNNLGNVLRMKGDIEGALSSYQKVITLNPVHAPAYNNIGVLYGEVGQHVSAIHALTKAVELNPGYAEAWNNLSAANLHAGNHKQAVSAAERSETVPHTKT